MDLRFDPEIDRRSARLADAVRQKVIRDSRRIIIVGAGGWVGRTIIALLHEALGDEDFAARVKCFGSRARGIEFDDGKVVPVRPLGELIGEPARPTLLFHLAFLTMDKVGAMDADDYVENNRSLSNAVLDALDTVGVDRLFFASSGAAAFADDAGAAPNLRLYGGLKRDHEALFSDWARAAPQARRTVIARIFSVSGPWINKHEVYALASFILDALEGRPVEVRSPKPVWRGYVAVRELVSLVFAILLADDGAPVTQFETGGEALELEHVAQAVVGALGGTVQRHPMTDQSENRYVGDHDAYAALLARYGLAHLALEEQVVETAAYLARHRALERTSHA